MAGWDCQGGSSLGPDICVPICGDGLLVLTEVCDDGNDLDEKGCAIGC